ncbi:hypothetical protein OLL86_08340 [Gallibacterium anatis]|uniref:hypothetical protein n=1 Tax=Gallibacterium anatis TaxID=750 RepID=UPI000A85FD06|nr:hypothetical protein [Gallibacterium anatis]UZD15522.1 hypothetical protein OLL86_08340 [Gallibacterium anatis]
MATYYDELIKFYKNDLCLTKEEFVDKYENHTFRSERISNKLIERLIKLKINFSIKTDNLSEEATRVEKIIEDNNFSCRVYTENRSALVGASALSGIGGLFGIASAVGIAAHNLATYNPDFEIGKNLVDKKINIVYKK